MNRVEKAASIGVALIMAVGGYAWATKDKLSSPADSAGIKSAKPPLVEVGSMESQTLVGVSLDDPRAAVSKPEVKKEALSKVEPERFQAQVIDLAPDLAPDKASANSAQSAAPLEAASKAEIISRPIRAGETFRAPAISIVGGEALIEGERLFDDIPTTGQISVINEEATVTSPFGGFVISGGTEEEMSQILGRVVMETLDNGCGNGCSEVDLIDWPAGRRPRGIAPVELDRLMRPGETLRVQAGSIVKGDVVVNGRRLFDNDENTGAITEINKDADVFAEFGANITFVGCDKPTVDRLLGAAVEEMKLNGCVGDKGCDSVEVFKVGPPLVCDIERPKKIKPTLTPVPTPTPTPMPKGK